MREYCERDEEGTGPVLDEDEGEQVTWANLRISTSASDRLTSGVQNAHETYEILISIDVRETELRPLRCHRCREDRWIGGERHTIWSVSPRLPLWV